MKFGHFDEKNREFVIERPDTPLPWINYLGCEKYCALISNTAGGYSFWIDPLENRILRYRYNNIPSDRGGRYIYIKDCESNDFWSVSWQPVLKDTGKYKYECRHGLGYTKIRSEYGKIETETVYFVPLGENLELWMLNIKNKSLREKKLKIFSFAEFCLPNALEDMTNFQANLNIGETDYENGIIYHMSKHRVRKGHFAFFGLTNRKVNSFDTRRDDFLGPYGDLSNPRAVIIGHGSNKLSCGWAPVGSHCASISLKPGEEKPLIFVLGVASGRNEARKYFNKYKHKKSVDKEIEKLKQKWEENLGKFKVNTPDKELNLMVNTWNQYQCRTTFNWSRSASYYESGIGRGMGFRDTNQDILGFVYQVPAEAKKTIYDIASTQFEEGDAHHQYSPLTKQGRERGYSDDHLWLVFSVAAYIKETGDMNFLNEDVPFNNGTKAALIKHLERAVNYSFKNTGPNGFPLSGYADWNDCLNMVGPNKKAESILVAQMLVAASSELARIFGLIKNKGKEKKYLTIAETMKNRINTRGWDGSWYIRAYDDNQKPVGSRVNKEGKIFLETQGWALMSGVASGIKARKTLDSVRRFLATEHGIILQQPAYKKYYPGLGDVSAYPPGLKENAGIFCHPNPWIVIAECILGRGENAYKYYKSILPCVKDHSVRRVEPYVYCQMVAGKDHPDFGEGKNSWLTGTAAWNFVAVSQHILGIKPDYDGLEISPCIPKRWKGFNVKRVFRGSLYDITVLNPGHVNKGVKQIHIDGKKCKGYKIPAFNDGEKHVVTVIMG